MFDSLNLTPLTKSFLKAAFRSLKKATTLQAALLTDREIHGFSTALWAQNVIDLKQQEFISSSAHRIIKRKFLK